MRTNNSRMKVQTEEIPKYTVGKVVPDTFKYHTEQEAEKFAYYSIPKELFTNSRYKHISTEAKLLYGLLRDRNQLSLKNGWVDEEGRIYIIFTRDEVMEILDVSNKSATKLFKELAEVELIKEKRQGLNQPNITYVGQIIPENTDKRRTCKNYTSGSVKNALQEVKNLHTSNTDINNTDLSQLVIPEEEGMKAERTGELTDILQQAQVELFESEPLKDTLTEIITDLYADGRTRNTIKRIDIFHIDTAIMKYREAQEQKNIKNPKLYFKRCLLSAIEETGLKSLF